MMPMAAGTLMAAAMVHRMTPHTGCLSLAAVIPATSNPTMMASLCTPPMSASRVRGLSTASTKAEAGSRP